MKNKKAVQFRRIKINYEYCRGFDTVECYPSSEAHSLIFRALNATSWNT